MEIVDKLQAIAGEANLSPHQREALTDAAEVIDSITRACASSLALNGCLIELLSDRGSEAWSVLREAATNRDEDVDDD